MSIIFMVMLILLKLYGLSILLRFSLQFFRADFYNPVSQSIVKLTNPVLLPLRKIIPGYGGIDIASLIGAYLFALIITLIVYMNLLQQDIVSVLIISILQFFYMVLDLFFYLMIGRIILSFLMMGQGYNSNPFLEVIYQVTEPFMRPVRRLIPPVGVFDFSPILLFIAIFVLEEILFRIAGTIIPLAQLI